MIQTGFETRVKIQEVIENQLPEFILDESPKAVEFLKQYYISQEFQGGTVDIVENLDQYLKLDILTPEVVAGETYITSDITESSTSIFVESTKGYPNKYGLLKIDDEIITYTGITTNSFIGCIRGFSGITTYRKDNSPGELVFTTTDRNSHIANSRVTNLSSLFLKEFYKKIKYTLTPGLENYDFVEDLNVSTFIKEARSFYQAKGTDESFRILFNILYGVDPKIINLEDFLIKPSSSDFLRREILLAELISGDNPLLIVGQTIRKSTDVNTQASVSSIEIITRGGKSYYKISLFIGYGDNTVIDGIFTIPGKTKVLEDLSFGSTVITVDSTIGFNTSGSLICNGKTIKYTDKTINQFLNCKEDDGPGIKTPISATSDIRSDEVIYSYENGDLTKKVEFRITGVLNKFTPKTKIYSAIEGEKIYIKNLGEQIKNPQTKTFKELFANSWIYNTSSRYQIKSINGASIELFSEIDKSSLTVGDTIEILLRNGNQVVFTGAIVNNINLSTKQLNLDNLTGFQPDPLLKYDLRRKLKKAKSSFVPITYGNDTITADIQNLYNENDEYFYVTSNSLPSYSIDKKKFEITLPDASGSFIQGFNADSLKYSIISFNQNVPFITGDEIYYKPQNQPIDGLEEGRYFVEVLSSPNQIKLYVSRAFIFSENYLQFLPLSAGSGTHLFTLFEQANKLIGPRKILKKFPAELNIQNGSREETEPGSTGILINGVEILNYKSKDKVYYGPLSSVKVVAGGSGYDVINPPKIEISSSIGSTALIQPIIRGSLKEVIVDPQDFDINKVISVTIDGGNSSEVTLEPFLEKQFREVEFSGKLSTFGGGIDPVNETLTFLTPHNFFDGQSVIYDSNQNRPIGISTYYNSNLDAKTYLQSGNVYYIKNINNRTVKLYSSLSDYSSGINTVGFSTINTQGVHKFRVEKGKTTLKSIKIVNPGTGFENRKLIVKPESINLTNFSINFENHGFNNGDIISYDFTETQISGLSTSTRYQILKLDNNSFRLCDAGENGYNRENFLNEKYVKFSSNGSGYHIFKYPDIKVNINIDYAGSVGVITATPVITGSIIGSYLYEKGSDYGSSILNLHKKPTIEFKMGRNAQIKPIIANGKIVRYEIQNPGQEYYSEPDLVVVGNGIGAKLRAVVQNGSIKNIVIINPGINYNQNTTSIRVIPRGSGAILDSEVRNLTVNYLQRSGAEAFYSNKKDENLEYVWVGYTTSIAKTIFSDNGISHSPLIGWAYDGNPIYGPYGYSDPKNSNSSIKILSSGYELLPSNVTNRPTSFPSGFFVEDYKFDDNGDLDINNGRFCKTPDFPQGIYAYFVSVENDNVANRLIPKFPYFIGNSYRSNLLKENNLIDQYFDFNESGLIRNTFPYKVSDLYAGNDFLVESNELINQFSIVESTMSGKVDNLVIKEPGTGYKVNDVAVFDNDGTEGGGVSAYVSEILGKDIANLTTTAETYDQSIICQTGRSEILVSTGTTHTFSNKDKINLSNLSSDIFNLTRSHQIFVPAGTTYVFKDIPANATPGIVTDIYVSSIPSTFSIESVVGVGTELMTILNIFSQNNILRVKRGTSGTAHTVTDTVQLIPNSFYIDKTVPFFDSKLNDKMFFNPKQSVGLGTTSGVINSVPYTIGNQTVNVSIPNQSIYLPNHPFKTNQLITIKKDALLAPIAVSTTPTGAPFYILSSGNQDQFYVINKSKDYIGIVTNVGLTTNTSGLYFRDNGSDSSLYSIESNYTQVTAKVQKVSTKVTLKEEHKLQTGDLIKLNVIPKQTVGIGTTTALKVYYDSAYDKLVFNSIGFSSSGINTSSNTITIQSHKFKTGDKVFYYANDLNASGLSTGGYFVYRVSDNMFKLCETYNKTISKSPEFVNIVSVGGTSHNIGLINPPISVYKENNLVFTLTDPSLFGYKFKLFYDKTFKNEFVSIGNTDTFSVINEGVIGISTQNGKLTLKYNDSIPTKLFYSIEKSGFISTSDLDVKQGSEIALKDSLYNGKYSISGIGVTTFNINLENFPEELFYDTNSVKEFSYTTNSLTENGGVANISLSFGGANYKKVPVFKEFISKDGRNAFILPESENIGKLDVIRIFDPGFEYSTDKTLRPEAYVSPLIRLQNANEVSKVNLIDGGKNYTSAPNFALVHPVTRELVDNGLIEFEVTSNSISNVKIIQPPKGLDSLEYELFTVNNSNGIAIESIESSTYSGIVTCYITTPVFGFTNQPFKVGDKIFVEGIQKNSSSGNGFNSTDYGYKFFSIVSYVNSNPAKIEYQLPSGESNPGIAKTFQNSYATIINQNIYPQFTVERTFSNFFVGEKLLVWNRFAFIEKNITITDFRTEYIKIYGLDSLEVGDIIKGKNSGSIAEIRSIIENKGIFEVNYSLRKDYGWTTDTGKLNLDYQVTPDNDYYQNLSYTVQSTVTFDDLVTPVNSLLHTAGLKNFADTSIISNAKSSIGSSTVTFTNVLDFITEERVDSIHDFDLALDVDVLDNTSKFLKLRKKRLADYIECRTNRVLSIDDVSGQFSNSENSNTDYVDIIVFTTKEDYSRVLVQVINPNSLELESTEIFVFKDKNNIFTFQKQYLTNTPDSQEVGYFFGNLESDGMATLRFAPYDPLNKDYDVKVFRSQFNTSASGIGTRPIGNISLSGINTYVGLGTTSTTSSIIQVGINSISGVFANIQVINPSTLEKNFAEIYLTHDGTDTYRSEYYLDTEEGNGTYSDNFIGTFSSKIESGVLKLDYTTSQIPTLIKAEVIGFASTSLGIGTYTFVSPRQTTSSARSAQLFSEYSKTSGISTVFSLDSNLFTTVKSYIRVSVGETSALHQVLLAHDGTEVILTQYPYLSIKNVSGLGTFEGSYNGSNVILKFYPDSEYSTSNNLTIQSYNEAIYTFSDSANIPVKLDFGTITQSLSLAVYNALEGVRINRKSFNVTSNNIPIFAKTFDPQDSTTLNLATGIFNIKDHFFVTGEKLLYTPKSTFIGIQASSVGIGSTLNSVGVVTTILPSEVYAIKLDNDSFKISTRKDYSILGIGVTFTSHGSGNAHQLEMDKKIEKSVISVDGVIQSPLTYTPISHTLLNNGGSIGIAQSYFALSGISSIYPEDLLKVDNEFMKVNSIGLGTTSTGPIIGIGTYSLVYVERSVLGTAATSHTDSTEARIYSGTYNIRGNTLYFISAPRGDANFRKNSSNLYDPRSTFGGRVYLKKDYSNNVIFDDISRSFDGFKESYPLTVQGINTTGIETGNGLLLINSVFQTPTTDNNPNNNYTFSEVSGITSVVFSGITSSNGSIIKSVYDINQNQLPRGGVIVSLGTTTGIGYAPLVGAAVTAVVGAGGSIKSIGKGPLDVYGSGYRGSVSVAITETGHVGTAASIIATVGLGGTLAFTIVNGGSGYVNPTIQIRSPNYQNLPITGVFRRGVGLTTECGTGLLLNVVVGSTQTELRSVSGRNADASNLIVANKQLIAEVAVGRMLNNYPGFSVPGGSQNCVADVISVLECLAFNLKYGGNERIYDAAKLYITNGYLLGEEQESIYTFIQARDMAIQAMRNEAITIGGYSTLSQYFDNTIEGDISGLPGVYSPGDCADVASAIDSFVGIVTFSIRDNSIPASRVAVTTSFFEVTDFQITRPGYGFRIGDVFKPVGLVTDRRLASPIQEFTLSVIDVFNDSFTAWSFGQLDYIDSIKELQDGIRTRFPLVYDGNLLSFEKNDFNPDSESLDLSAILLILINGVIQEPNKNYTFSGGTSFSFTSPPRPEDKVSIFFYRGTRDVDSVTISNILSLIKIGDSVKVNKNDRYPSTVSQESRVVHRVAASDKIETNSYNGPGIDITNYKPITLKKQKVDRFISGEPVYKTRDSLESLVFPSSKIIKNLSTTDTEIFVDNARFFEYESDNSALVINNLGGLIVNDQNTTTGKVTASVSTGGLVQSLTIVDSGSGYIGTSINVSIAAPPRIGIGIGSTAVAEVTITDGQLSTPVTILNPGYGYSSINPPSVIVSAPPNYIESVIDIQGVEGFTGIITGISTITGTSGNPLALKFYLRTDELNFSSLNSGYPILIYDTFVGNGVTSIDTSNSSIVSIGTTFLDNIYYIHSISSFGNNAEIVTNIKSNSNIVGILTSGSTTKPLGKFTWGRLYGFGRSADPISIGVTGFTMSGLSTFPTIQRRGYGIRDSGGLKSQLLF